MLGGLLVGMEVVGCNEVGDNDVGMWDAVLSQPTNAFNTQAGLGQAFGSLVGDSVGG